MTKATFKRQQEISISRTMLQLKLHDYQDERDLDDIEMLRGVTFEIREILLDYGDHPVKRAERFSALKDMIKEHQEANGLTDVQVLQALCGWCSLMLSYMREED